MTRETKRTAPPQIACGGNISSPACIPRPSNHQARSNVRTYVCTRPTRMCLAASEAYVRTYVRTYTINEVATTALPLHHPRPGNIWEDRSPPRARRPQSPPDSPSTTYVRTFVRPSVAYARKSVRTYVRPVLFFQRISLVFPHSVGTSRSIITQIDPNYPPRLANLGAGELEQPPISEYVRTYVGCGWTTAVLQTKRAGERAVIRRGWAEEPAVIRGGWAGAEGGWQMRQCLSTESLSPCRPSP